MQKDKPFDFQKCNHITGFKNNDKINSWDRLREMKKYSKKNCETIKKQREADPEGFREKRNKEKRAWREKEKAQKKHEKSTK